MGVPRDAKLPLQTRHVRLIVGTAGLLALFSGGFLGVMLSHAVGSRWELLTGLLALAGALGFAALILWALRLVLAPDADYLRPLRPLKAWSAAIVSLYVLSRALPLEAVESRFFQSACVLAVWGAGILAAGPPGAAATAP